MSEPSDVWQNSAPAAADNYSRESRESRDSRDREASPPRREERESRDDRERERSPRRDRSRSPAPRNGGGGDGPRGGDRRNNDVSLNAGNNLHVSGLARSINDRQLEELFSKCGKIVKAQVMADPHTQESRGFGFVMFETNEEAENAISTFSGTTQDGRVMTVAHAKRGRARTPTPGRYHGTKFEGGGGGGGGFGGGRGGGRYDERPYQPRSYDSRYSDRGPRYDDRRYDDRRGGYGGDRYEDRRGGYDDRRGGYDDRRGGGGYGGGGGGGDRMDRPPPPDDYYRGGDRRDDRGPRYDDRPRY